MVCLRILTITLLMSVGLRAGARADDRPMTPFDAALREARSALEAGDLVGARQQIDRALERDAGSTLAWDLRAQWGEKAGDADEEIYALHRGLALLVAQKAPAREISEMRSKVFDRDPVAKRSLELAESFTKDLYSLAKDYEKARRPHSAIQVYQKILALNPERTDAAEAIARVSAAPDPSLAETARQKDLLADVSAEWVREFDNDHSTWDDRGILHRDHYSTHTDAGYEVMVRTAESMEQMSAFYRRFFRFDDGRKKRSVPHIDVKVFRDKKTYLAEGTGPPVEWSAGQFAGHAVETYIGGRSFERMTRTLFHEAAHQFVGITSGAKGWVNEGIASYFEGCRILANGTVLMNLPAEHRLFELSRRMTAGWMTDAGDGIDPTAPSRSRPTRAPRLETIVTSDYEWGPAWYAPTWGVVYFFHNFQDPADGRFVYRDALWDFVSSGGPWTKAAGLDKFRELVLMNPSRPTKGVDGAKGPKEYPRSFEAMNALWKDWILALRDEQRGDLKVARPWRDWANHAASRGQPGHASEFYEKGLVAEPENVELLMDFAGHLAERERNPDQAAKLVRQALRVIEARAEPDPAEITRSERRLEKFDPKHRSLKSLERRLARSARSIVSKYLEAERYLMTMHTCSRLAMELNLPGLLASFEEAALRSGKSLSIWRLAYNERDLTGWTNPGRVFAPDGETLRSRYGEYRKGHWSYYFLTLDTVTSGDFSLEAEVRAGVGKNAFCGLVFGRRDTSVFHTLIYFPQGNMDLASFRGLGSHKTWRSEKTGVAKEQWRKLRVDVVGRQVDAWCDGEYVFTQEFDSLDVLRGSFGLITGVGSAEFRNIRFLAREPRDPGARILRKVRMENLRSAGPSADGSYLGRVPPWPKVAEWVQAPARSWADNGPVPTLLVFFSIRQNDLIPLHVWLAHLAKQYEDVGLRVVSICEPGDLKRIRPYLETRRFPGSVGADYLDPLSEEGLGETLDAYFIGTRYNFPRVLLLDIDHRVVWEGNPGFPMNKPWRPGDESFVDGPLAQLVSDRALRRLPEWRRKWTEEGVAALEAGDLPAAAALLKESPEMPGDVLADVARAQKALRRITHEAGDLTALANTLSNAGREPALCTFIAWAEALGMPVDAKVVRELKKHLGCKRSKAWKTVLKHAAKLRMALKSRPDNRHAVEVFVKRIRPQKGAFVEDLVEELSAALESGDLARAREIVTSVESRPGRWLAQEHFVF